MTRMTLLDLIPHVGSDNGFKRGLFQFDYTVALKKSVHEVLKVKP